METNRGTGGSRPPRCDHGDVGVPRDPGWAEEAQAPGAGGGYVHEIAGGRRSARRTGAGARLSRQPGPDVPHEAGRRAWHPPNLPDTSRAAKPRGQKYSANGKGFIVCYIDSAPKPLKRFDSLLSSHFSGPTAASIYTNPLWASTGGYSVRGGSWTWPRGDEILPRAEPALRPARGGLGRGPAPAPHLMMTLGSPAHTSLPSSTRGRCFG